MDFEFIEIESCECVGEFVDEYVYDIEMADPSHTFIANDILVHNSVYTTYGTLFECMTPEYKEKYKTDRQKVDWILKFNKEFVDPQNNQWCDDMYRPRHGKSIHEFELEIVGISEHVFDPCGFTMAICLKESHICIHTWPEFNQLTLDIYLCNYLKDNSYKVTLLGDCFKEYFKAKVLNETNVYR